MKIGLVQYNPVWEDKKANKKKLKSLLHDVSDDVDLFIFPEMTLSGFTMKSDDKCLRFTGHDAEGEAIAKKIARRLKLSRRLLVSLGKIVRNHHRVFNIASLEKVSLRSKAHFFRVMDIDGLDLLFLSIADARATRGSEDHELEELVKELIPFYFDTYRVRKMPPILKGDEIMKIFQIPEGIIVGRILKKVQEAEGMGIVNDKEEAVEFIRGWLHGKAKGVDI